MMTVYDLKQALANVDDHLPVVIVRRPNDDEDYPITEMEAYFRNNATPKRRGFVIHIEDERFKDVCGSLESAESRIESLENQLSKQLQKASAP